MLAGWARKLRRLTADMTGWLKIGFTGTRSGMTIDQSNSLRRKLSSGPQGTTWTMFSEFHHGDCVGADEEAHDMMRVLLAKNWPLRVDIVIHPPKLFSFRAGCGMNDEETMGGGSVKILGAKDYLARDRDIVNATDMLIACPAGMDDVRGVGGTWYTIRYAREKVRPILIIHADGTVKAENWAMTPGERQARREELKEELKKAKG